MPYYTEETLAKSRAHKEKMMTAWRDEVARRKARRIAADAAAEIAPTVLPPHLQRHGVPR